MRSDALCSIEQRNSVSGRQRESRGRGNCHVDGMCDHLGPRVGSQRSSRLYMNENRHDDPFGG
jgi:hypothetical protein